MTLRTIKYKRHEFRHRPQHCTGTLLTFVYDVPYLDGCGVFPPLHVLNHLFASGGGDGGMSPGASWKPFSISPEEYENLVAEVLTTPVREIQPHARYARLTFTLDPEFDYIQDRMEWRREVCKKHRARWHEKLFGSV
jgi:hypothetical protein